MFAARAALQPRLMGLQKKLAAKEIVLISKPNDIFYFTGFPQLTPAEREAFLLISSKQATLFHHSFSPTLPKKTWLATVPKTDLTVIASHIVEQKITQVLIDEDTLSVREYLQLKKLLSCPIASIDPDWLWQLRMIKDRQELALMRQAGKIVMTVFAKLKKELKPGMTERFVANRLVSLMLEQGAQAAAFPVIVAFGDNGALPHHQPTQLKLNLETPVLIDCGAQYEGYLSDMTRTFWFGKKPAKKFLLVEQVVQTAYQKTLDQLTNRPAKLMAKDLDRTARQYITSKGFGNQFIHTTGHGLGVEIHEPPSLFWQNEASILPGTVLTIEPGIYLQNEFGYRHENTVAVTDKGTEILTKL